MDGANELRKIEKEIVETRALIIKSNNLTNSLSADVRNIARRQSWYERSLSFNSFIAYLVFAAVAMFASWMAYDARKASLEAELTKAQEQVKALETELNDAKKVKGKGGAQAQTKNEKELAELHVLISEGKALEVLELYEKIPQGSLSFFERKLLDDVVRRFRGDLSMVHYTKGLDLVAAKKFPEAVEEFRQSLRYKDDAGHAKAAKIHMANALRLQGKPQEAIAVLQRVIEEHLDPELADDAMWYLALAHQEAHQRDEARSVLRALMRQYPQSQFFRDARIRAAELQLRLYQGGGGDK